MLRQVLLLAQVRWLGQASVTDVQAPLEQPLTVRWLVEVLQLLSPQSVFNFVAEQVPLEQVLVNKSAGLPLQTEVSPQAEEQQ